MRCPVALTFHRCFVRMAIDSRTLFLSEGLTLGRLRGAEGVPRMPRARRRITPWPMRKSDPRR